MAQIKEKAAIKRMPFNGRNVRHILRKNGGKQRYTAAKNTKRPGLFGRALAGGKGGREAGMHGAAVVPIPAGEERHPQNVNRKFTRDLQYMVFCLDKGTRGA